MERLTPHVLIRHECFRPRMSAFSLLELLAVIAVIAIMTWLGAGALGGLNRSYSITQSAEDLRGLLLIARQEALTRNSPVEIRFCRPSASDPVGFVQSILHKADGSLLPLARPLKLPDTVLIDLSSSNLRSTLFNQTNAVSNTTGFAPNTSGLSLPGLGTTYEVFSFFLRPNGSTSLPWNAGSLPCITIRDALIASNPPTNYATLLLDPANAKTFIIRP